jgi:hypothetical protein
VFTALPYSPHMWGRKKVGGHKKMLDNFFWGWYRIKKFNFIM